MGANAKAPGLAGANARDFATPFREVESEGGLEHLKSRRETL